MADTSTTKYPIPSANPDVLEYNAKRIDEFVTSSDQTYTDRGGIQRKTISGVQDAIDSAIGNISGDYLGAHAEGLLFEDYNDYSVYNGVEYRVRSGVILPYESTSSDPTTEATYLRPFSDKIVTGSIAYSIADVEITPVLQEGQVVTLSAGGRSGQFIWTLGDFTTEVAADTPQGLYIASSLVDVTVGCWVRKLDKKEISLSMFCDSTTATSNEIVAFFAMMESGYEYIVDISGSYTGTTPISKTVSDINITSVPGCVLSAPNIDQDLNYAFIKFVGTELTDVTTSADCDKYSKAITLDDASAVQAGDLLHFETDIYFNGIDGVSGFAVTYVSELHRVRYVNSNDITLSASFDSDMPNANITRIRHWRPIKNVNWYNPLIEGQGINGNLKSNGEGATGLYFMGAYECNTYGGNVNANQNRAVGYDLAYECWSHDLSMDSLNEELTAQGFYGVVHSRSRFGGAIGCDGDNIRRVADTSGAGGNDVPANIHHERLTGTSLNGSVAGTHACHNYSFKTIKGHGSMSAGITLRGINSRGSDVEVLGDAGIGVIIGVNDGSGYSQGSSSGVVEISDVYLDSELSVGISISNDGEYDIEANVQFAQNYCIEVDTDILTKLKLRGKMKKGQAGGIIVNSSEIAEDIGNIDISCDYEANTSFDLKINGSASSDTPLHNLKVEDNFTLSTTTLPFVIGSGYFQGETTSIKNNIAISGSGSETVDLGQPYQWTCRPEFENNTKYNSGYITQFRRFNQDVLIGTFDSLDDIDDGTTILDGDRVNINNPSSGAACEHKCYVAGTTGSLTSITGTIAVDSDELTLTGNDISSVYRGCFITIPGAGDSGADLAAKVIAVSSDYATATLHTTASTAVTDATIDYRNPSWADSRVLTV